MKKCFISYLIMLSLSVSAQEEKQNLDKEILKVEIDSADWSNLEAVQLEEMQAYALKLNTPLEKKYYKWLERRVDDVYPFAYKAVTEYYHVKDSARKISNRKNRKKYIKLKYKSLANEYEDKLKKLSPSRGQILVKLIERETKITAYDMIKELRGGVKAFLWYSAGNAFNIDLKRRFDPSTTREDVYLEVILRRGIANGKYPENWIKEKRLENLNPILGAFGKR